MTQFDELAAPLPLRQRPRSDAPAAGSAPPPAASILHLQRAVGNAAVAAQLAEEGGERPITRVVAGGGSPLDRTTRASMEQAFGEDFSDVRVHDDSAATEAAHDVAAKAATVGNHIVFRSGEYSPGTSAGQHLLAHELTHVVQQRSGPVDGTPAGGGVQVSDPSDRFEQAAEANASRITAQLSAEPAAGPSAEATGLALQRESAEEESEEVQMARDETVQREAEEEESEEM